MYVRIEFGTNKEKEEPNLLRTKTLKTMINSDFLIKVFNFG